MQKTKTLVNQDLTSNSFTWFINSHNYIFFAAMEVDESQEMVKDSPKTILLIGVLVGILGTMTLGLIGALIFVTRRKRQSGNEPSLLVHEE